VRRAALASALLFGCRPATPPTNPTVNASAPREPAKAPPASPTPTPEAKPATPELDAIVLPTRPAWTDKYAVEGPDQVRFHIGRTMARHGLDRAQAVEAQNHYRDLAHADPRGDLDALLQEAIRRARAHEYEDRRARERLAAARFIVAFDLDDTLYDQRVPLDLADTCADFVVEDAEGKRAVKLVPGWDAALRRIEALGGAIVFFTANTDAKSWNNARAWMLEGKPITEHARLSGFLTNGHLVQQHKDEGDPVQEPSKDLRIVDESLRRTILVDDNLRRVVQFGHLRTFKKFHGADYCRSKDPAVRRTWDRAMPVLVAEIEDSVRYMDAHPGVDFATAYRPFTELGRVTVEAVREAHRWSQRKAITWVRAHPEAVDEDF
jgi:hypothetical protein